MGPSEADLVYDWNRPAGRYRLSAGPITLYDETLRDGIQGPSITDPSVEDKKRIVELAAAAGIHSIDIGLPGAGPRAVAHVTELARHISARRLPILPSCAARTHQGDIRAVVEIAQRTGVALEVMAFLGTSPIRLYVEEWDVDRLLRMETEAIRFAVAEGLSVTFVTEDTVRTPPETLRPLFRQAIECGASRLCLCDTVGHATPDGVHNLVQFTREVIDEVGAPVGIDWHGHNDRGLALTNSLRALEYGADRVHGTALGIGERVGNTPLDQILVNLWLLGELDGDLRGVRAWCEAVSAATGWAVPPNYPVLGRDAFRTATGVHAAAVIKARTKGDAWLADRVYSSVPASATGDEQHIEVGPMSGLSNVHCWLSAHGYAADPALAGAVLEAAKASERVLPDPELHALVDAFFKRRG